MIEVGTSVVYKGDKTRERGVVTALTPLAEGPFATVVWDGGGESHHFVDNLARDDQPPLRLSATYNSKFGQWTLRHNRMVGKGETTAVAVIYTSEDPEADKRWAEEIARRFNAFQD